MLVTPNIYPTKVNCCWTLILKTSLISWFLRTVQVLYSALLSCRALIASAKATVSTLPAMLREQPELLWAYGNQVIIVNRARNDHIQARFPATQSLITPRVMFSQHLRNQQI